MQEAKSPPLADFGQRNHSAERMSAAMKITASALRRPNVIANKTNHALDCLDNLVEQQTATTISAPAPQPAAFLMLEQWTVEETADYLRCQAQTIRKAISLSGEFWGLRPRRFGRRWLFNAADVRAAVEGV
jgi:excisionase family DNA binding protein